MMRACLLSHTHYTDITGEINVFELAQSMHEAAKASDVVLCPGVGFDVVPTDCLASQLKQKMPDATHLTLGFDSASSMSPGTAKTSLEGLAQGGKVRSKGQLISVPLVFKTRVINFGNGEKHAMTIPWGDVSTAYYSTGIANIEVYIPISPKAAKKLRRLNWLKWLLALSPVQNYLKDKVSRSTKGPDEQQRENSKTFIWGEISNAKGETVSARYQTLNGYHFTYLAAIEIANHLLNNSVAGGTYTPSQLIDNQLAQRLAGSTETIFD